MSTRDADLASYYDQDADVRASRDLDPERVRQREEFASLLRSEGRSSVVEIGIGPGRDAIPLRDEGFQVAGVDLSSRHVELCREQGIDAYVASVLDLPFDDDAFDAGWTMSTLLHVPDSDLDAAVSEIVRVLRPGAPLAIGVWGGTDSEGPRLDDTIKPPRFFSFRSDERLRELLGRHGTVEEFRTWEAEYGGPYTYQWCVLRTP